MDLDTSNTDEYFVTALQIFDCCAADNTGTISVDALMDKCAPLDKSIKSEYSHLRGLLDPEKNNPNISVKELAMALNKFSESQKKFDLDESFNVTWNLSGQAPQDSDSGISTDAGYQLMEELQSALREKTHLTHQLQSQLEFNDRQHEEALLAMTAERDAANALNNILRDGNAILSHLRQDYEEASERLCESETALEEARRELELLKRRARSADEQVAGLESDKLTLQELLSQSKGECHRINEMYASRQSALLLQNEALRGECAALASRARELDERAQHAVNEKMLIELELKDVLNKSNLTQCRLDRSIDVSYTEDQILTALDSLNADSRFGQDVVSIGIQAEVPCVDCERRAAAPPAARSWRRYMWDFIKSLFSIIAGACLLSALVILYNVSSYHYVSRRCARAAPAVPWRWLSVSDLVDNLFRIEYVGEVPM